jgi:hypothetical protein
MTCKDAVYRQLLYGSTLDGLLAAGAFRLGHLKQDMRLEPDQEQSDDEYPWVIFRRVSWEKDDRTGVVTEVIEFELIGKQSSATKGDDLLEQIKDALVSTFGGKHQTWGKYDEDGNADPSGGKRMRSSHQDTSESFDSDLDEKIQLVTFRFAYKEA